MNGVVVIGGGIAGLATALGIEDRPGDAPVPAGHA